MTPPKRLLLDRVPRIHFYEGPPRCPEDVGLPTVLRALMEFFGEKDYGCKVCLAENPQRKVPCSYAYFMGITGAGFFLSWKKGWWPDNCATSYMAADRLAGERRGFKAVGRAFEYLGKNGGEEALFRRRILESIQAGTPVTAYGVIGPPELCIIAGYDDDGDVLMGWNLFQKSPEFAAGVEFEPTGHFRKRNWFKDTEGLLFIGEKREKPPLPDTYRDALEWALQVTHTPIVRPEPGAPECYRERANGLAAYQAWAEHLLRDEDFAGNDESALRQRHSAHDFVVGTVAENRWYASLFLVGAAEHLHHDATEHLLHAAACYAAEHALMWRLWDLAGGIGNPEGFRKTVDPAVRRTMVPIILQARDYDATAAKHLQQALAAVKQHASA